MRISDWSSDVCSSDLATVMALAKKIRKVAVVAGVCHGFIGNRMLMPRQVAALKLLMEGATPEQIDRVHVDFGKIGRASCRERVCQYVESSVYAVALKKKQKKKDVKNHARN